MDATDWNRRYDEWELVWSAGPNQFVAAEVADLPAGRALDLACGEGRNALFLAEQGWRVTAVDFSDVALEKARRIAARRNVSVDWVLADLLEYEPAERAWDLVLVCYLQLPAGERRRVLEHASAAVAPGGSILVIGHDVENLTSGARGPKDPAVLLTPDAVAGELPGLRVERAERVRRSVPTDDGEVTAIDTLVRATRA
ncbi:MAG: class I SAM-dependent methyltransferase [Acidimicrobiia bacterium]|nr:class I SAM-dependent methyltransferase [Acidimicrobiia bacterium]